MCSQQLAIQPHTAFVEGGCEMQFDVLISNRRAQDQRSEVPRDALVVVILTDIPGVRHTHDLGFGRQGLIPSLRVAFFVAIDAETPIAIQIHPR